MEREDIPGYSVVAPLGVGGTAELFLAERHALSGSRRRVALKRILPAFAQDPVFRNLFAHEARLAMQLGHRNIVQVYDFVEWGDSTALVMEYIDGCDLRTILRGGPLTLEAALFVAIEVLRGLDYAHRKKGADERSLEVVHRDVAPGNVLVSREGEVKVADFGLARSRERLDRSHGGVKGTFAFMAPEQAEGKSVDARADVFAAGALFYAMLSGSSPFEAEGPVATLDKVRSVSFTPLGSEVDPLIARALERDPARRFQSAAEMLAALEGFAHERRFKLDPGLLTGVVAERAARRAPLPSAFSATLASPKPEPPPPLPPSGHTRVLDRHPRRRARLLPWILGAGGVAVAGVLMWPRPVRQNVASPTPAAPSPVAQIEPSPVAQIEPSPPAAPAAAPPRTAKFRTRPGYLTVSADPWAYVFIDGRRLGTTPLFDLELAPGNHEVTLENLPLGASRSKQVRIVPGEHQTIIERLAAEH